MGVWFYAAETHRYLYVLRSDPRHPGTWGLPGGRVEPGESLLQAMTRECREELGHMPEILQVIPLEKFTNSRGSFEYDTFFATVAQEFRPRLNHEHWGYAWIDAGTWPRPMHPGLWNLVGFSEIQSKISQIQQRIKDL